MLHMRMPNFYFLIHILIRNLLGYKVSKDVKKYLSSKFNTMLPNTAYIHVAYVFLLLKHHV